MGLLLPVVTPNELEAAIKWTRKTPDFLDVRQYFVDVKTHPAETGMLQRYFNYYEDPVTAERMYLVANETKSAKTMSFFVVIASNYSAKFDKNSVFQMFDEFNDRYPSWTDKVGSTTLLTNPVRELYTEWFNRKPRKNKIDTSQGYFFYQTDAQKTKLLEEVKDGIQLPEGYHFDRADPEKDGQRINETWIHSDPQNVEFMKYKLATKPHSLVRSKATGEAVAFELSDAGFIHHLFVMPEHRLKGLGTAVEKDICSKVARNGLSAFKGVEFFNTNVMESSMKSPYWTRVEDDQGEPVTHVFHFLVESGGADQ